LTKESRAPALTLGVILLGFESTRMGPGGLGVRRLRGFREEAYVDLSDSLNRKSGLTRSRGSRRSLRDVVDPVKTPGKKPVPPPAAVQSGKPRERTLQAAGPGESDDPFAGNDINADTIRFRSPSADENFGKFQSRLKKGKSRLCRSCGEVMAKSSRMVLSPLAGLTLVTLGTLHMVFYGIITNFYQSPWFLKFVLPSIYYVGSIFIGVGVVFFFLRERVWICRECGELRKR